jgi:hypothetical protein
MFNAFQAPLNLYESFPIRDQGIVLILGVLGNRGYWWFKKHHHHWIHGQGIFPSIGLESWWMPWIGGVLKGFQCDWKQITWCELILPWNSILGGYALKSAFNGLKQWIPISYKEMTWENIFERWYHAWHDQDATLPQNIFFALPDAKQKVHLLTYFHLGIWDKKSLKNPEDLLSAWGDVDMHMKYGCHLLPF